MPHTPCTFPRILHKFTLTLLHPVVLTLHTLHKIVLIGKALEVYFLCELSVHLFVDSFEIFAVDLNLRSLFVQSCIKGVYFLLERSVLLVKMLGTI